MTATLTPDTLTKALADASRTLAAPMPEALEKCREEIVLQIERQFEYEETPSGQPWKPWYWRPIDAPANHPTLFITGRLESSLTDETGDAVRENDGRTLRHGTTVPYAATHEYGADLITERPMVGRAGGFLPAGTPIHIPPRPFASLSDNTIGECVAIIADAALEEVLKGL